jgi:hypothetical protein
MNYCVVRSSFVPSRSRDAHHSRLFARSALTLMYLSKRCSRNVAPQEIFQLDACSHSPTLTSLPSQKRPVVNFVLQSNVLGDAASTMFEDKN